jgi:hypothetical protein
MSEAIAQKKFSCPACGAAAEWNPAKQSLVCPFCGTAAPEIRGRGMNGKGMIMKERFPSSFLCRTFLCLPLPNAHSLSC